MHAYSGHRSKVVTYDLSIKKFTLPNVRIVITLHDIKRLPKFVLWAFDFNSSLVFKFAFSKASGILKIMCPKTQPIIVYVVKGISSCPDDSKSGSKSSPVQIL